MDKPKHDKTPLEETDDAIQENIRLGYMVEVSPGRFSLTPTGLENARGLLKMPVEETLRTYVSAINGKNDLKIGLRMCAVVMTEAADEITRLKGEVERLTAWAEGPDGVKWHTTRTLEYGEKLEAAESALAAKQALIDELVDGLETIAKLDMSTRRREATYLATYWRCAFEDVQEIASSTLARSSGKAGSDA